jgi:hypothetical protein
MGTATAVKNKFGNLLSQAIEKIDEHKRSSLLRSVAAQFIAEAISSVETVFPVVVKLPTKKPEKGESWSRLWPVPQCY